MYRRVLPDEMDRGKPFHVYNAGLKTFAQFGVGIGIYFTQLLVLSLTCFVGGLIMTAAISEFHQHSYGLNYSSNPFVPISAACAPVKDVTVTSGCDNGATECIGQLRPNCELPYMAGAADLAMSVFVLAAILASKLVENVISEDLDDAIQTAQDYSVVVNDPNADADNPDEWYRFFSRFGTVRYVTITRKNSSLTTLIAHKHYITKKLELISLHQQEDKDYPVKREKYLKIIQQVNTQLEAAYTATYPTCRVYITYELEEHQRLCLKELEVPDIAAIMDLKVVLPRQMFRGENVLDVCEPPEPDAVLWENIELDRKRKMYLEMISNLGSIGLLVVCYYLIDYSQRVSPLVLSVVVATADTVLPVLFEYLTDISAPHSQGKRQSNLQVRIFLARLLLSTVFPYLQTAWNGVLDAEFIAQIVSVQIAACFVTPVISFFDFSGIFMRHVYSPLASDTQEELNSNWMGSDWSLAERYTGISKILFVSLYYTLLNPIALVIAMVAFLLVFLIDRYLLLRKWKPCGMLDAKIARRLRQQGILAVALHMAVTLRFIYSWPMDNVYLQLDGTYAKADKYPPLRLWLLSSKNWMGSGQAGILRMYRITTVLVCCVAIYVWIIDPVFRSLHRLFCFDVKVSGDAQDIPFTSVKKLPCYVPTTMYRGEQYLCSYIRDLLPHNKPSLLRACQGEVYDLSLYVPTAYQPHILSVVKYYGDAPDGADTAEQGLGLGAKLDGVKVEASSHVEDVATVDLRKYVTNEAGVLSLVSNEMPNDLMEKIRGRSVPPPARETRWDTVRDAVLGDTTDLGDVQLRSSNIGIPLSPEERKKRRVKRNYNAPRNERHQFSAPRQQGRSKVGPLPPIGGDNKKTNYDEEEEEDVRFHIQPNSRSNRVLLRPVDH